MTLIALAAIVVGVWSTGVASAVTIAKPASLVATATSSTTISLSWHDASNNEIGFDIQRSIANKTAWKKIAVAPVNATTFGDTGLTPATGYKYRIRALKPGTGASSYSNTATATTLGGTPTDTTPPTLPGSVTATATSCSTVTVGWSASTDAGGSGLKDYVVYRDGVVVQTTTATSFADSALSGAHTYGYQVQARDNAGNASQLTVKKSVTTPTCPTAPVIPAPGGFAATADSCGFAFAKWNAIFDPNNTYHVTKYNLYRNNVLVRTVAAPTTTAVDSGLSASTSYTYAVTAADAGNNESAKSTAVTVTTTTCQPAGAWVKTAGGPGSESPKTVAVDAAGNTIIGGGFRMTADFGSGPITASTNGDMFIAKYSATRTLVWVKHFASGISTNELNAIAVDAGGNVFAGGAFFGTLNLGGSNLVNSTAGTRDAFFAKFSAAGAHVWSKRVGGTKDDEATGVTVDTAGNPYFVGSFWGKDIDFGNGHTLTNSNDPANYQFSGADAYMLHLNNADGSTSAVTQMACSAVFPEGVALDAAGNTLLVGYVRSGCTGVFTSTPQNDAAFIAKYDANAHLVWTKLVDGPQFGDRGNGIAVDSSGNVFATGYFTGSVNFGDATRGQAGSANAWGFLVKLNGANGATLWSKAYGSLSPTYSNTMGYGVVTDASGNVTVVGTFSGTIDMGGGPLFSGLDSSGFFGSSAFVGEYASNGTHIASNRYGSATNVQAFGVTRGAGGAVLTGFFGNTVDFGFGPVTTAGFSDLYILNTGR